LIAWNHFKPSSLYDAPEILIYKAGEWIARRSMPDTISLMNGIYDVQLTTIPSIFYPKLEIKANQILTKSIPAPGFLSLSKNSGVHADLYTYKNNTLTKCYTFQPSKTIENLTLLPGKYKIIYRTHRSLTIYGTFEKQFEIQSTDQVQINL
jgi:Ca-activated chloride channel family protein